MRSRPGYLTVAVLALSATLACKWKKVDPFLVEYRIAPVSFESYRAGRKLDAPLDPSLTRFFRGESDLPGAIQVALDSSNRPHLTVTSALKRVWLPRSGGDALRTLIARHKDVLGVFDDPKIKVDTKDCKAPQKTPEASIQQLLYGAAVPATAGEGVLLAVADNGLNDSALWETRHLKVNRDLSWPEKSQPVSAKDGHGTTMAYDATSIAPAATVIDLQIRDLLEDRLSNAVGALDHLIALVTRVGAGSPTYKGIVVLNSWTMETPDEGGNPGSYGDDPQHPVTRRFQLLTQLNVDIVFAAGNQGCSNPAESGAIFGAASLDSVLTFSAVSFSKTLAPSSSPGPGRLTMSAIKPDLAAYSYFVRDVPSYSNIARGTSSAAAVGAGVVAAQRSVNGFAWGQLKPDALKQQLLAAADHDVCVDSSCTTLNGHDNRFGHGVIRFVETPKP